MDSHISLDGACNKRYSVSVQATDAEKQQVLDSGEATVDEKIQKLRQFMVGWFFNHHASVETIESDEPFVHLCPKCSHETQYFVRPLDDYILSLCLATPCLRKVLHIEEEESKENLLVLADDGDDSDEIEELEDLAVTVHPVTEVGEEESDRTCEIHSVDSAELPDTV